MNNTITVKSTLEKANLQQEQVNICSQNSKNVYQRNIKAISKHMKSLGLEPILDYVTYDYCQRWLIDH